MGNSKKRIAFLIGQLTAGGAERVVSTLSNELVDDYEVCIITFGFSEPFYKLDSRVKIVSCTDSIVPSKNSLQAIRNNLKLYRRASKLIQKFNIDIIVSFMTRANIIGTFVAKKNGIPIIISERNNPKKEISSKIWQLLCRYTYPKANFLVVQTKIIKEYFVPFVEITKIHILANPISPELTIARGQFSREKVVLNIGRLTSQKAQDFLIRTFAKLNEPKWRLRIIGDGPKKETYLSLISELGMNEKIELVPPTSDIQFHYNSASIFAFTSIYEGFPNALTEAMHFGLACISTDCPTGPSELIRNGANGFLIPMNDEEKLSEYLTKLMYDSDLRKSLGHEAKETVSKYESKEIASSWSILIERALKNS